MIPRISSILLISILLLVTGCTSNPRISSLRPEQRARLNTIQVFKGEVNRTYKILGTVKGLSCHRYAYQKQLPSEDEAIEGVRLEAALLGADAVINTACQVNSDIDWIKNCWSSIICVGDAIKYED